MKQKKIKLRKAKILAMLDILPNFFALIIFGVGFFYSAISKSTNLDTLPNKNAIMIVLLILTGTYILVIIYQYKEYRNISSEELLHRYKDELKIF